MNRLNEIEARANAATEGPWEGIRYPDGLLGRVIASDELGVCIAEDFPDDEDAEFIAHARTDVPALVAALRAVLELHAPDDTYPECPECVECSDLSSTGGRKFVVLYPCDTVQTIRQHLGGDL